MLKISVLSITDFDVFAKLYDVFEDAHDHSETVCEERFLAIRLIILTEKCMLRILSNCIIVTAKVYSKLYLKTYGAHMVLVVKKTITRCGIINLKKFV